MTIAPETNAGTQRHSPLLPAPCYPPDTEWTVFLYEIRYSSVRYLYNQQANVKASTRAEALEKAKKFERGDTHLIGVSLIPTAEYNALNNFNWKWKS